MNESTHADARFMRRALALARSAAGLASPNPTVGCVIVRDGVVVGEGRHEYAGLHHAEIRALQMARERAQGAVVYLTLEPCSHQGRTPPCAPALVRAGIGRAVIAAIDPNPQVCGRGVDVLRSAGIAVDVGLMEEPAMRLIEPFACHAATGRPLVAAKAGMTLDGRIAAPQGGDHWITSPDARAFGQDLRLRLDAVLCGIGTLLADDPELTYRGKAPKARRLVRIVLDSELRTPAEARVFRAAAEAPLLVVCAENAPAERRRTLEQCGAEVIRLPRAPAGLELAPLLEELGRRKILGVLVEGGSAVHWSFLSQRLIDKFYFVLAPIVLGGERAVPCVGGAGYASVADAPRFAIRRRFNVGSDLVLEAYPSFSRSVLSPWLRSGAAPSREQYSERASARK
jgi:diaminohydroxyphosphoribosylaminopyrimidine deaminase/5-amino-6-(5-phosphoribosylamino)uracil reductase